MVCDVEWRGCNRCDAHCQYQTLARKSLCHTRQELSEETYSLIIVYVEHCFQALWVAVLRLPNLHTTCVYDDQADVQVLHFSFDILVKCLVLGLICVGEYDACFNFGIGCEEGFRNFIESLL